MSASERLIPLFERSFDTSITFVDATYPPDESSFDVQAPALTALGYLRKTPDDFANATRPFLKPDPDLVGKITDQLCKLTDGRRTIGVSWRTSNKSSSARRNLDLERLVEVLPQDACLVNLQYGAVKADIDALEDRTGRIVHIMDEIDIFYDLDSFAALISACDEIVSIDNSTVHFAGAIGTNCHVLLPFNADWRWGPHEAMHSYWYEQMKLHWQDKSHDWEAALVALRRSL